MNLGYVLNVIEDQQEREHTLRTAFDLAEKVLVVSVRVDQSLNSGIDFSDGWVTNSGSFQKIYTQAEFREYVQSVLGRKPVHGVALGICVPILCSRTRPTRPRIWHSSRLPRLSMSGVDLFARFAADGEAQALLEATRALARLPLPSEFDHYPEFWLLRFGPRARIEAPASRVCSTLSRWSRPENFKKNDILTYFAMLFLRGVRPPRIRLLPAETQADIKLLWPSYKNAMEEEAAQFLFNLRKVPT